MRILTLIIPILISMSAIVFAQTECSDRPECWPEGSAMRTGLLLVEKLEKVERILASRHKELVGLVSAASSSDGKILADQRLVMALKTQQTAWLKFRADECELIGSLSGAGGSWPSTYATMCAVNLTEQRLRRVKSAIRCIEKIPKEKRLYEQSSCLQQLAPLANTKQGARSGMKAGK
jgi:uncharacterized protein YecT (DUF1311 family)